MISIARHRKLEEKPGDQKRIQKFPTTITQQTKKKWVKFSYHSPLIRKITNLFKRTNLNIALHATKTTQKHLAYITHKTSTNCSGIHKPNTCKNSYAGQSGRSIPTKHKEHTRYIRTNKPTSAYALYVLNNRHEYGTAKETLGLLRLCNKGTFSTFKPFFNVIYC